VTNLLLLLRLANLIYTGGEEIIDAIHSVVATSEAKKQLAKQQARQAQATAQAAGAAAKASSDATHKQNLGMFTCGQCNWIGSPQCPRKETDTNALACEKFGRRVP
jgi:hypothetical protein